MMSELAILSQQTNAGAMQKLPQMIKRIEELEKAKKPT
jgi:uncharacterized protein (UPF0335 family)